MKYLLVELLKSQYADDTCNAASHRDHAYLECETGPWSGEDVEKNGGPILKLVTRQIGGREYKHVEPVASVPDDMIGWMAGGNFVYTSDSRFPSQYPLSLHDRLETSAQYQALSK